MDEGVGGRAMTALDALDRRETQWVPHDEDHNSERQRHQDARQQVSASHHYGQPLEQSPVNNVTTATMMNGIATARATKTAPPINQSHRSVICIRLS